MVKLCRCVHLWECLISVQTMGRGYHAQIHAWTSSAHSPNNHLLYHTWLGMARVFPTSWALPNRHRTVGRRWHWLLLPNCRSNKYGHNFRGDVSKSPSNSCASKSQGCQSTPDIHTIPSLDGSDTKSVRTQHHRRQKVVWKTECTQRLHRLPRFDKSLAQTRPHTAVGANTTR